MLTQLLIYVLKEEGSRGEYRKKRCPGWVKFMERGLSLALNWMGAWTAAAVGCENKKHPFPGH